MNFQIDIETAKKAFLERARAHAEDEIVDNSKLYAGSPMYYYCRFCRVFICSKAEGHWDAAPSRCEACDVLVKHGVMDELLRELKKEKE